MSGIDHLLVLFLTFWLTSCASSVTSTVNTYYEIPPNSLSGHTVVVLGMTKTLDESLEFKAKKRSLEDGFRSVGMSVVSESGARDVGAEYVVFFGYGSDQGREQLYSYNIPIYGQTGISSSSTTGIINSYGSGATYSGTTSYTPSYGITGYQSNVGSRTVYGRSAAVEIWKPSADGNHRKIFELRLQAQDLSKTPPW